MTPIKNASMGTVLLLEALEHIREPQKVIDEIYRILIPGGYCVATTLMTFEIHRCPYDYWRFCPDGLCYLFRAFHRHELILEHHKALPRGIWTVCQKPLTFEDNTDKQPIVRVSESGTSWVKNIIKRILNKAGYDLIQVPKDTELMYVVGVHTENGWSSSLK